MRKNGSRLISYKQYRLTDLFLFAVILIVAELISFFACKWFPQEAFYSFSFMLPIVLVLMIRWGWWSVFCAIISAILCCALNKGTLSSYIIYIVGNSAALLMLLPLKFIGGKKITSTWWGTALFTAAGWLCVYLARSTCFAICYAVSPTKGGAADGFTYFAMSEILSLAMAVVVMLILRKLDGMCENQKEYLLRLDRERKEKMRRDNFGDEPVEIDEEALSILNKDNDLY